MLRRAKGGEPMLKGHIHPDFWGVAQTFSSIVERANGGGAAVCVYHQGERVVDLWGGFRDEAGHPWESDTLALSYSTTKGVASTLLHILADRDLVDYDQPVSRYWPEFAQAGKEQITVRQLMGHQAGLYDIRSMISEAKQMLDWGGMVDALAASQPVHTPGAAEGYHGLTYGWLVGELVQRLTGQTFAEALESEIAQPLGLEGLYCGLPEDRLDRRAHLIDQGIQRGGPALARAKRIGKFVNRGFALARISVDLRNLAAALLPAGMEQLDFNSEELVRASIPAANGMFDARSLARLYALLANGGELDGVRLLSERTVNRANTIQSRRRDRVVPFPMHWRLGYHRAPVAKPLPNAFGHAGFGGSGAWADPDRRLAVALVLNSGVGTPFGDLRIVRIGNAAVRCAERR
ncbi:MAG: beta-lactamase family protein [Deltaproteobacteria bacterium]|nr:beta-lactamase family protein [Deltaproteobacteria bacterium]MBW2399443.1 beta-lactamase family protein [Deltaproteobacteria bacterium]MBW2665332.1 beta-lactamase family protein [Deltaproteobacteria bacterium]